MILIIVIKLT